MESAGLVLADEARGPCAPGDPASGSRAGGARCGARGKGCCGERWARARMRGVSGWLPRCGGVTRELCPPEKLSLVRHTAGLTTHLVFPRSVVPSLRAIRPADRGPAVRRGGWGRGLRMESAGLVFGYEAFQVFPHMAVRPTEPCSPEKLSRVRHTAGPSRMSCLRELALRCPVAPGDPASGSRTGGAVRRRGGRGRDGERWARAC